MGWFEILIIRCLLAGGFAFLISRFFFKNPSLLKVVTLAVVMLALAYLLEYLRKREHGGANGT